jgi:hypothetical protein
MGGYSQQASAACNRSDERNFVLWVPVPFQLSVQGGFAVTALTV